MAKRERDENRQVLLQGFGVMVKTDDVIHIFHKFGRIEFVRFLGRRQCLVQFEMTESVTKALQINNTKQPSLFATNLLVSVPDYSEKPVKKCQIPPGAFVMLDPPRFNNYLIPVLPSFVANLSMSELIDPKDQSNHYRSQKIM
jgi:hypothetical protein